MTKVKICGIRSLNDVEIVNELKPDYIGFVFAKSKRQITPLLAKELKSFLNKDIKVVGVFVNEKIETIENICKQKLIDIIQLHGEEDKIYINQLKKKCENKIIKAINLNSENVYMDYDVDYLLFDNGKGGTGEKFNWELIPRVNKPFFLAGGLTPFNVVNGVNTVKPYGVDASTGVELRGSKNRYKIKEFIRRVRNE
ncbi:MAG: phosphoribosylanthranilate isomerase [Miniphocaeibacter sp.]|uniref:phosphoribosylanthranilate isomerase n=1 Tax=Miniphocaeibacter sp. TaxID=3100973 RepID=UPI0018164E3D|nr:phosphoribosylanthranilate isomerase [Gallicola sp.]